MAAATAATWYQYVIVRVCKALDKTCTYDDSAAGRRDLPSFINSILRIVRTAVKKSQQTFVGIIPRPSERRERVCVYGTVLVPNLDPRPSIHQKQKQKDLRTKRNQTVIYIKNEKYEKALIVSHDNL